MGRSGDNNVNVVGSDYEIFINDEVGGRQLTFNNINDWLADTACTGAFSGCRPVQQVSLGRVVWHTGEANDLQMVYLFDGADVVPVFEGMFVFPPVFDDDLIAFQALGGNDLYRVTSGDEHLYWGAEGDAYQVFVYEHYRGRNMRQLTVAAEPGDLAESPWIEGDQVYWQESIAGAPAEIYLYDGQTTRQLTDNTFYEYQFVVNEGRVIWSDGNIDPNGDIFLLEVAPKRLSMQVDKTTSSENASDPVIVTLTRENVASYTPLNVQIATSLTNELIVPETVVIPAGETSVSFAAMPIDNNRLDGNRTITLLATASGFQFGDATLQIQDYEPLSLVLDATSRSFPEDVGVLTLILSRDAAVSGAALQVNLASNDPFVSVTPQVTIPAGATTATVNVSNESDEILRGIRDVRIVASAVGFVDAHADWQLLDNETLSLNLDRTRRQRRG